MSPRLRLERWEADDLGLVEQLFGDPRMTVHLGGPQSPEQRRRRLDRWRGDPGTLKIVELESGQSVGFIGFWALTWHGEPVLEIGWSVIPAFQRRGIAAGAAALVIDLARASNRPASARSLHAFPAIENAASNALCQRLGFTSLGPTVFGDPPRPRLRCNEWRLGLDAEPQFPRGDRGSPSVGKR